MAVRTSVKRHGVVVVLVLAMAALACADRPFNDLDIKDDFIKSRAPRLDEAFDNWSTDHVIASAGCDGLRITLSPKMSMVKTVKDRIVDHNPSILKLTRAQKKAGYQRATKTTKLNIWCAAVRQDSRLPRCFSDYSKYVKVGSVSLAAQHYHHSLPVTQDVHTIPSLRGQNAAQCFFAYDKYRKLKRAKRNVLAAFRLNTKLPWRLPPKRTEEGSEQPPVKEVTATIRSTLTTVATTMDFDLSGESEAVEALKGKVMPDVTGMAAHGFAHIGLGKGADAKAGFNRPKVLSQVERLQKLRSDLYANNAFLDSQSPMLHSLLGMPIATMGASLQCKALFAQSTQLQNYIHYSRSTFNPPRPGAPKQDRCPFVLAHRVVTDASAAEGSVRAAIELATADHVDGAEIDIFVVKEDSGERKLVVSHDADLSRIIGYPGKISDLIKKGLTQQFTTISGCDLLTPLEQFLDIAVEYPRFRYDLELKPGNPLGNPYKGYAKDIGHFLGKMLRTDKYKKLLERDQIVISSFDPAKTKSVNRGFEGTPVRVARAKHNTFVARLLHAMTNNKLVRDKDATAVIMHHSLLNKKRIKKLHKAGFAVGTYTIFDTTRDESDSSHSEEEIARLYRAGVDWMETDDPTRLKQVLYSLDPDVCHIAVRDLNGTPDGLLKPDTPNDLAPGPKMLDKEERDGDRQRKWGHGEYNIDHIG